MEKLMNTIGTKEFGGLIEPSEIPSSVTFPIELMQQYLPTTSFLDFAGTRQGLRRRIWDAGCGFGLIHDELVDAGFDPHGVDVNPKAVEEVNGRRDRFATQTDITAFGSGEMGLQMIGWIETVEGVLWQALGPSLIGERWKKALNTTDLATLPGGYLFVADFARPDVHYTELDPSLDQEINVEKWQRRIEVNYQAFGDLVLNDGTKFPRGAVAVAKPGKYKRVFDWCSDPKTLRAIFNIRGLLGDEDIFERFAQNMDMAQFKNHLVDKLEYRELHKEMVVWPSRSQRAWYPGFIAVYQKPEIHRYHPLKMGLNPNDEQYWEKWKEVKHTIPEAIYWTTYFGLLRQALNKWDNRQPKVDELGMRMYEVERGAMKHLLMRTSHM